MELLLTWRSGEFRVSIDKKVRSAARVAASGRYIDDGEVPADEDDDDAIPQPRTVGKVVSIDREERGE